ncbi:MAG: cardiolipin synthase [Synergistaceae bacterium]|nr:cardiolipin synthase [Synergistaceae bacterium]
MQNIITLDNNIRLLLNGRETFSALKEALTHAQDCVNLEYFSFHDDETGTTIKDILTERSRHGVKVRMIIDAAGSWRLTKKFISEIKSSGIEFKFFMPFSLRNLTGIIHRDHRKIITVDNTTGFIGGFNIGDVYLRQWRDTHIKICGDSVRELDKIFFSMWDNNSSKKRACHAQEIITNPEGKGINGVTDCVPVKIIASGKGENFRAIADEYIKIISSAKKRVWITTPYFVPDNKFISALYSASRRGVDVRIIIPSSSNHMLVSWAAQSYIDSLIKSGIRIFIYQDRFIHAKTMIADSHVASVGSANLDSLSFEINYEVQALIYSTRLVNELESVFLDDLTNCTEETQENRKNRPLTLRIKESTGRLLAAIL